MEYESWAQRTIKSIYGAAASNLTLIENYTACFPTAPDGEPITAAVGCGGWPNLFVLNGLAGGGIARGPGAGEYVSQVGKYK